MNHRGALRLGQNQNCGSAGHVLARDFLTAYQFGLRSNHVLAFHPTGDCHGRTVIRLTMEFCLAQQLLSLVRLGTLNREAKTSKRGWRGESEECQGAPCLLSGSYAYMRMAPSSSHVTRESCWSAKKKSAAVTQTLWASFAKTTSL